jgi:TrmH family RNA methyltransferase
MEHITSRQNAHFKHARKLAESARERNKSGLISLDGTRLVGAYATQFGLNEATLLVSGQGAQHAGVQAIIQSALPQRVYLLADELFAEISNVETPEGIVCIAGLPHAKSKSPDDFRILLDGVQDPGNLGGILRTAAAAGATSAHLSKGCADAWSPRSLRGGMGAQFVLPLRERVDLGTALVGFRGTIVATSPRAESTIYDTDLSGPVAFIFGSEGNGLRSEILDAANRLVHIPMHDGVESLNVAAAAAICCFEKRRQMLRKSDLSIQ